MAKRQTKAEKIADARINRAYLKRCVNIEIGILDIPKIFDEGNRLIAQGADDSVLENGIAAFVSTLSK